MPVHGSFHLLDFLCPCGNSCLGFFVLPFALSLDLPLSQTVHRTESVCTIVRSHEHRRARKSSPSPHGRWASFRPATPNRLSSIPCAQSAVHRYRTLARDGRCLIHQLRRPSRGATLHAEKAAAALARAALSARRRPAPAQASMAEPTPVQASVGSPGLTNALFFFHPRKASTQFIDNSSPWRRGVAIRLVPVWGPEFVSLAERDPDRSPDRN